VEFVDILIDESALGRKGTALRFLGQRVQCLLKSIDPSRCGFGCTASGVVVGVVEIRSCLRMENDFVFV
jgi:hypothetical protein